MLVASVEFSRLFAGYLEVVKQMLVEPGYPCGKEPGHQREHSHTANWEC